MRMKSWESPRRGKIRNNKSKTKRPSEVRQLRKKAKRFHKKLKAQSKQSKKGSGPQLPEYSGSFFENLQFLFEPNS